MKRSPHSHNDSGLATVEFAILGSLLCLLVFAIISAGFWVAAHTEAADEARFEAREAAFHCTPAQVLAGDLVTRTATKPVTWFVPLIPSPGDATETVSYRCGG